MSAEKRARIQDLARESTLIDAINLAQDICNAALDGGTGPGTTDGTGPGTTDGTGPGTTDGTGPGTTDGTGPGTTDGTGPEPPLPCTEFDAGCEVYYEAIDDGRTTTFDGECHDCVQSMAIPEQMNYSVVGSGFKNGTIYKMVNVHGTVVNADLNQDGITINPNEYEKIESSSNNSYITIEPKLDFNWVQNRAPFGPVAEEPYDLDNPATCIRYNGCNVAPPSFGPNTTVTDFKIFVQGFDFSKPNYNIDSLALSLNICPGPTTDDPYAPGEQNGCIPIVGQNYPQCNSNAGGASIHFSAYIYHPARNRYESPDSNTISTPRDDGGILDLYGNVWKWMPISEGDYFGFGNKTFNIEFNQEEYDLGIENSWLSRLISECVDPHTGTIIVRIVSSQPEQNEFSDCPLFNVHFNEVIACNSGDCSATIPGGLSKGQTPIERQTYDCSDTALVINNANDTHVKMNSLQMNAPLIGENWFTNFLIAEGKNKPFISGSYLNSDYIDTYPSFSSFEGERFSDFLYPNVNGNNNNWTLTDTGPTPTNLGFITIEELGIGDNTRIDSFTIHGNYGEDTPSNSYYQTNYTFNTNNLPGEGVIEFDLEYIPPETPPFSCYNPFGYILRTSSGSKTVVYPNFNDVRYSASVSLNIKPGDVLTIFVRRYIALTGGALGICREYDSPKVKVKNLIFENVQKRYGQVVSCIVDLDYCNTNQGYDPTWPSTDIGTNLPIENGINGLKIIETMRAETNDPDLIIERGLWLYNHTEQVWVGNPYGRVKEDINLSPGIDLNILHPYWAMRSKCIQWEDDSDPACIYDLANNIINPIECANSEKYKLTGTNKYGYVECEAEQFPQKNDKDDYYKPGCAEFDCCCQICRSPEFAQTPFISSCCGQNLPYGWDDLCSNVARRFCGNKVYCEDTSFFPPSGYGLHGVLNRQTIPSGCCGSISSPEPAFQFGTVDWTTHLNFESYDAKDFVDSNGKVTACYVFTSYKTKNSYDKYELDESGPTSRNSPYTIYIDRLRAVPASSAEFIPPPDVSAGYSSPLIVLPPWLIDLIPDGTGPGTTEGDDGGSNPGS